MSKISYTENFNLTQYSEVDEPVFLNDITRDNALIDAAIHSVTTTAETANTNAASAVETANDASDKVDTLETTLTNSIQDVADDLADTNTALNGVADRVTAAEAAIELLEPAEITALENKVNTNTTNITQLQNTTTGINDRLLVAESDIVAIEEDVSELQSCCTTVQGTITDIQAEQETQNTNISANASAIDGLDGRLDTLEAEDIIKTNQILNITNDIGTTDYSDYGSTLSAALKNIGDSVSPSSTLAQRVEALEDQNGSETLTTTAQTISGAVNELDSDIATNAGDIDDLETQNGNETLTTTAQTLSGAVNELDADIATNKTDIDALEALTGSETLTTTAQTLTGAVNELDTEVGTNTSDITALETQNGSETLTTTAQTLSGAVNELDAEIGSTNISSIGDGTLTGAIAAAYGLITSVESGTFNSTNGTVTITTTNDLTDKLIIIRLNNSSGMVYSFGIGNGCATSRGLSANESIPGFVGASSNNTFTFKWDNVYTWYYEIYKLNFL